MLHWLQTPHIGNNVTFMQLENGEFGAIMVATAGIERLQIKTPHTFTFTPDIMLPACGHESLIETRE